jgi:hypothetical protein
MGDILANPVDLQRFFAGRFPGYLGSRPAIGLIVKIIAQPVLKR